MDINSSSTGSQAERCKMDYTNLNAALDLVLSCPEEVLCDLGTKGTVDLLHRLSTDSEVSSQIQKSKIVEMIDNGVKYFVGNIMLEDENNE